MALTEWRYTSPWGIEHVYQFRGKYGGKHEKRADHEKPTRKQIREQNQKNRENRVRRKIQLNFDQGDWYLCLKYKAKTRLPLEEVMEHFRRFIRILRGVYQKHGTVLKYMYRLEIGSKGGIHLHVIVNRLIDPYADMIISDAWMRARGVTPIEVAMEEGLLPSDGMVDFEHIRREGNAAALAEYMVKEQPEVLDDGRELTKEEKKATSKYGCSRNLKNPKPEVKEYSHWTMRRILELGAEGLNTTVNRYRTEGYAVDKDSWKQGINPVTGLSYLCYFERPLLKKEKKCREKKRPRAGCTVDVKTVGDMLGGVVG